MWYFVIFSFGLDKCCLAMFWLFKTCTYLIFLIPFPANCSAVRDCRVLVFIYVTPVSFKSHTSFAFFIYANDGKCSIRTILIIRVLFHNPLKMCVVPFKNDIHFSKLDRSHSEGGVCMKLRDCYDLSWDEKKLMGVGFTRNTLWRSKDLDKGMERSWD